MATQGPNSGGTFANDVTVGTIAWTTPSNAAISDGVFTAAAVLCSTAASNYLKATNFGFSIPVGSTINGILVEIQKKQNGTSCP